MSGTVTSIRRPGGRVAEEPISPVANSVATNSYPIVASEYAGTLGVPALFHKTLFSELFALRGDVGAKSVIRQHRSHCVSIPFAAGAIDLDTPHDVDFFSRTHSIPCL